MRSDVVPDLINSGLKIVDFPGAVSAKLGDAERERAEKGAGAVMVPLKHSA